MLPFVGHVGAGSRHDGAYLRADDETSYLTVQVYMVPGLPQS